jgi:omega-6 fatty acid desaturase (delta-12 desaturase)
MDAAPPPSGFVNTSREYRQGVLTALSHGGWDAGLEQAALAAAQRLARARQAAFTPHVGRALLAAARTILFVVAPLLLAVPLWHSRWALAVVPLIVLAGMGLYGGVAILHDLVHGSFLPVRRLNVIFGHALAPLLLMEYSGFRRSHLDHHKHAQAITDPKRFGVEHKEETTHPDHSSLDLCPAPVRPLLRLAAKVVAVPLRIRHVMYLTILPLFMGPAVLLFSGEFSVARRDWRKLVTWTSTIASAIFLALLYAWSPTLLVFFLIALVLGHSFTFHVFASHMTPNQVYWTSDRRAGMADALNVSDIHCGALVRWLGHGLADYHSLHHLSPAIPCYHLPEAEASVAPDLAPLRAPAIDLLRPAACAVLFDGIFSGVVHKNSDAWDYEAPGGMRRVATPETDV